MFWDKLNYPIVGLSPMDGVTDAPMRFIAKKYGKADIIYTEFVSAEGLWRIKKRGDLDHKIWRDLMYDESERPVIAQLFGSDPDSFFEAAKIVCELGFDGIDINMGCPSPGLEKRGGGAGLMRDMGLAGAVIEATRRGVADWRKTQKLKTEKNKNTENLYRLPRHGYIPRNDDVKEIPVSVKTRIGSDRPDGGWWKFLAEQKLSAVAMHGRTFKQLYSGEADWEVLLRVGEVIRESGAKFLGNGDLQKVTQCHSDTGEMGFTVGIKNGEKLDLSGKVDGVLIGRAAIGNPWVLRKVTQPCLLRFESSGLFSRVSGPAGRCHSDTETQGHGDTVTLKERLVVMVEHAKKYEEMFKKLENSKTQKIKKTASRQGESKNQELKMGGKFQFFPMRKHLASYVRGFDGSSGLRKKLMTADNAEQVEMMVEEFLSEHDASVN